MEAPTPTTPLPLGQPIATPPATALKVLHDALIRHANGLGFAVAKDSSRPKRQTWVCSRAGRYNPKGKSAAGHHPSKQRRATTRSSKTGCPYKVCAALDADAGQWTLAVMCNSHNHGAADAPAALPQYRRRRLTAEVKRAIIEKSGRGYRPRRILRELQGADPECELVARDISNAVSTYRLTQLGGKTPI